MIRMIIRRTLLSLCLVAITLLPISPISAQNNSNSATNPDDQFKLGRAYYHGEGVTQSYEQAGFWYRKAAEGGNIKAMNNLGIMFLEGQGTSKNPKEGYRWIRMAADKGDPRSSYLCGVLLCQGRGVDKNSQEGISWLEKAADAGNDAALAKLGQDYYFGDDGLKKDIPKALPLIRKAAESGNASACGMLGQMYLVGQGIPQDQKQAAHWFEIAARHGNPTSAWQYGELLLKESAQKAYPWFRLSILLDPNSIPRGPMLECMTAITPSDVATGDKEAYQLHQQIIAQTSVHP